MNRIVLILSGIIAVLLVLFKAVVSAKNRKISDLKASNQKHETEAKQAETAVKHMSAGTSQARAIRRDTDQKMREIRTAQKEEQTAHHKQMVDEWNGGK